MKDLSFELIRSWNCLDGSVNSMDEICKWLKNRKDKMTVNIRKMPFSYKGFWFYDEKEGVIRNKNNSFFQLSGFQIINDEDRIIAEQPLIIQNEIGYLGIICKKINGVLNFLMQAKIEPGNINHIQVSPTIQATKSNFTRMHGGNTPNYLNYFIDSSKHDVLVDQIQSEQASRFYKKRNRNIIIFVEDEIPVLDSHMWMTLGQIKELMKEDNVVNMDTRTVISCIPFCDGTVEPERLEQISSMFRDQTLFRSIFYDRGNDRIRQVYNQINDYKMFHILKTRFVPLRSLKNWTMGEYEISCKTPHDFKIIYCYIEIEGREVQYWEQPLVEANGMSVLGLFTDVIDGVRHYLVSIKPEMGSFDAVELGPSIQMEPTNPVNQLNHVESLFLKKLEQREGIRKDVILSEEGGRFYHEQNRNVILNIDRNEIGELPKGYFWMDYCSLCKMIQFNNCVNIQLRNLISIIDL